MPIYEYTCQACNKRFEQLQRTMKAEPSVKCPSCGSTKTERALSVFAVGAESTSKSAPAPMCQRCGRDGPCPSGF